MKSRTAHQIVIALLRPVQRLPLKFHYFWGDVFAWACRHLAHYREDVVTVNLARSFPQLKYKELKQIRKDFYNHLGEVFAETVWLGGCHRNPAKMYRQRLFTLDGAGELAAALRTGSVMVLNSHFGNWELMGPFLQAVCDQPDSGCTENDVVVVYRHLSGAFAEDFFRTNRCAVQTDAFAGYVESASVLRYAVEHRRERKLYVFPTDQHPYRMARDRQELEFLHQPTAAMTGAVSLAARLGMSVWYMAADREARGRYRVRFRRLCDDASAVPPEQLTEAFYRRLEEDIVRNPANYLWSHKRWK